MSIASPQRVVILGAGHAGGTAAALLRRYGFTGAISLLGAEPNAPYQRPPLSKAWLKGEIDAETLALKPLAFYADQNIDFRPQTAGIAIDRAARTVKLSDSSVLAYDALVLATGARAITLNVPGANLEGVTCLRTVADAERLKAEIYPSAQLAVIGGGYVGLEVAASARSLGADVTVIERESRILARVASTVISEFFQAHHERHGVFFELKSEVVAFEGDGRVEAVRLGDGRRIACDVAVVGVGAAPCDELAAACGLQTAGGIVVDIDARTSDPSVFAIGDVALRPMPIYGRLFRVESVPNALEQAKQAVCAITGRTRPAGEAPWQWSDQYDVKLQIAGYAFDVDEIIVRGDPAAGRFVVFHLRGEKLQSVEAVNSPAEFMMGKQLVRTRTAVDRARLVEAAASMRGVAG